MGVTGNNWYNLQSTRQYPIDGTATGVDNTGARLPTDALVDCHVMFPNTLGKYAFVSSISVTAKLVTVTFAAADDAILQSGEEDLDTTVPEFRPLAAITAQLPITEGRHYALTPLADGVGGWAVFGGCQTAGTFRCSSPAQSMLLPRTARSYNPLPVTSLRKQHLATGLTGVVKMLAGSDIEIVQDTRTIDGIAREALIVRLRESPEKNVYDLYRGPCATRPESNTCDRIPIRRLNTAIPDCNGNITLNFLRVRAAAYAGDVGGLTLSTNWSVDDTCSRQNRLPNSLGVLPNEYNGSCSGSLYSESIPAILSSSFSLIDPTPGSSSVPPDSSSRSIPVDSSIGTPVDSSSSSSSVGTPPDPGTGGCKQTFTITAITPGTGTESAGDYVDTFDNGYADGFSVRNGSFAITNVADYDPGQIDTWYPAFSTTKAYTAGSWASRNVSIWTCQSGLDTDRVIETSVRLQSGAHENGGIVFASYTNTNYSPPLTVYLYAYIDRKTNSLKLDYFDSAAFRPIAELPIGGPGLQLAEWYVLRLYVLNWPANNAGCYRPPWKYNQYNCEYYNASGGYTYIGTCPNCTKTAGVHLRLTLPDPASPYNAIVPHNIYIPALDLFWFYLTREHGLGTNQAKADFGYFHMLHSSNYSDNISGSAPGEVNLVLTNNSH